MNQDQDTMYDVIIIGGGPAGLSAALNARIRNASVLIITANPRNTALWKTHLIDNHVGMPNYSGAQMLDQLAEHVRDREVRTIERRVLNIFDLGENFMVSTGDETFESHAVILALGTGQTKGYDGEEEFLGRGVSYCATCDGMFYRERPVVVIGKDVDSVAEANYLDEIGCEVTFVNNVIPEGLNETITTIKGRKYAIVGDDALEGVEVDGEKVAADGVFILRPAIAPSQLLDGLELEGPFISVTADMETSVPGVWAAGDCTGKPLQVSKAIGQGQVAGLNAADHVKAKQKAAEQAG